MDMPLELYEYYTEEKGLSPEVAAQLTVADALREIARALNNLGTADAATNMGGLELVAKEIKDGLEGISAVIYYPTQE